ncbi:hypothetical protein KFK09_003939 [Dendrobium nobile]|uniref:Reverse transcriptase Ty1/copia-type domain-containing protein n=1 Tax=Dendrobium nobile TaxID=94219 RepID=A0A8T3BYY5_DENNO|nr:hypothetical protein KFK09_003939 [Dendrobium nobile]
MIDEIDALHKQGTWPLVSPPPHAIILGCKWTYRLKKDSNGQITRHKARLVAKGFNQQPGINYHKMFSPVAKLPTVRILLVIATQRRWPIFQLDISNAFLHGELEEEVYMKHPPGFLGKSHPTHVCKLHKAIYGLKQSPRQWYSKLTTHLQAFEFHFSKLDPSFLLYKVGSTRAFILIYVDDMPVTSNNDQFLQHLISDLQQEF